MNSMRIIAAGGGGADDSRMPDEIYASWLGHDSRLLYLPVAMDGSERTYQACLRWLESVFIPLGIRNINMVTKLDQRLKGDLGTYRGVYIGGGNTYRLLHLLRLSGFDQELQQFARTGGAIYGGSAGAIILGREIGTCAHLDANQVGLNNLEGLNLLQGYAVWCHYQPNDVARIREYVQKTGYPVAALSEKSGICQQDDLLRACGYEGVYCFEDGEVQYYEPGEVLTRKDRTKP